MFSCRKCISIISILQYYTHKFSQKTLFLYLNMLKYSIYLQNHAETAEVSPKRESLLMMVLDGCLDMDTQ